jgi:hypothetical protein
MSTFTTTSASAYLTTTNEEPVTVNVGASDDDWMYGPDPDRDDVHLADDDEEPRHQVIPPVHLMADHVREWVEDLASRGVAWARRRLAGPSSLPPPWVPCAPLGDADRVFLRWLAAAAVRLHLNEQGGE